MHVSKKILIAAGLLTALGATAAFAADEAPKQPHPKANFERLDANKDGSVSLAEFKAAMAGHPRMAAHAEAIFKRIDKNNDGTITKDEMKAWRESRRERRHGRKGDDKK